MIRERERGGEKERGGRRNTRKGVKGRTRRRETEVV